MQLGLGQTPSFGSRVATLRVSGASCRSDSQHRFWKPSEIEEEVDSAQVSEMLHSRHITFAGKFEPVQHQCRALRPNGKLCERQDRLKVRLVAKAICMKLWLPRERLHHQWPGEVLVLFAFAFILDQRYVWVLRSPVEEAL